jgi:hypothetical protein
MKMYEMGPEAREELGKKALAHAHKDYNIDDVIKKWDETLTATIESWHDPSRKNWTHTEI